MKKISKEGMVRLLYDSNKIVDVINQLVNAGNNFALFRHPNEETLTLYLETDRNTNKYFHITSFSTNPQQKAKIYADIYLQDKNISLTNISLRPATKEKNTLPIEMSKMQYEKYVADIIAECKNNTATKVVAARTKIIDKPKQLDLGDFFIKLLANYPTAFISIWRHQEFGLWCGATPEILIKKSANQFETMSLAGTKRIDENRKWTDKEKIEQQIVTDIILQSLSNASIGNVNYSPVQTHKAGHIAHIKSIITFSSDKSIAEIADILHPTPAVGGLPLDRALEIIQINERDGRSAYAGYLGTDNALYVNLRCMQILDKKIILYIGAGITKNSIPIDEWKETESKGQTLLQFIK